MRSAKALPSWIALFGGALFPLALAPLFCWPLGLVSLAALYWALNQPTTKPKQPIRSAFIRSWLFGFGQFATGVSWIYVSMHDHGGTPFWLAVPAVGLFAGFLALIPACWFALRQHLSGHTLGVISFAAYWVLQEWCRSWFLTGFPWLFAGDAHLTTWLAGWAPVSGAYVISFILALTAASLVALATTKRLAFLLPLLLWPAGLLLQQQTWTHSTGTMSVAVVQGNVPQDRKWLNEEIFPTIERYQNDTRPWLGSDLILWPETAITLLYQRYQPYMNLFADELQTHHSTVITGIPFRWPLGTELEGQYHNSIVAFGAGEGLYHKQRLVPFGEYIPLESAIRGLIPFFDLPMSSFRSGDAQQAPLRVTVTREGEDPDLALVAPFICYEIAYPDLVAANAGAADLLVTISNDAWFGDSLGPKQHMALAQMRALETGRWVLRSTNTGISALVNHHGEIVERIPVGERTGFAAVAERRQGNTPYMTFGLSPLLSLLFAMAFAAFIIHRRQTGTEKDTL